MALGLGPKEHLGVRDMETRGGWGCQAEEMAQVKDWGWRADVQEVKMVNIVKEASKCMSVWEQGTEK